MNEQKLYQLYVLAPMWLFVVRNSQTGVLYPLNQFPPEFDHMELDYINAITEIIPTERVPQKNIGSFFIRRKIWPFRGLTITFLESDAYMMQQIKEADEEARQAACMVSKN